VSDGESPPGRYETVVDLGAPVDEVFRHLTDPAAMVCWMGQHARLEAAPGGAFEVDINGVPVRGRYLEIDPPHRVVVSWGVAGNAELPPGSTRVEFTLTPTDAGTRLRLVHSDLPGSQEAMHANGWQHFLGRLIVAAAGRDPGPDPWNALAVDRVRGEARVADRVPRQPGQRGEPAGPGRVLQEGEGLAVARREAAADGELERPGERRALVDDELAESGAGGAAGDGDGQLAAAPLLI
jgi:uncharacterized protein YndB with AHSA1/START domain